VVVVPDRSGQGQEALYDADEHPGGGAAAVLFEAELSFEGVIDRLDGLPKGLEEPATGPFGFALACPSQQLDSLVGEVGFEVAAVVVLVADQDLPWSGAGQRRVVVQ